MQQFMMPRATALDSTRPATATRPDGMAALQTTETSVLVRNEMASLRRKYWLVNGE